MARKSKRSFLAAIMGAQRASSRLSNSVGKGRKRFTGATFNFFKAQNKLRRF